MEYRDKVFIAVAENLSFSKAAKELYISQPAVTNHIKELERKLGILLFERKGNKIYLTKAGSITYTYYKEIYKQYLDLMYSLGRIKDSYKGKLRIGASSTISQYYLPTLLNKFYKRYPDIEIVLINGNSSEIVKQLLNNSIDVALLENESIQSQLEYTNISDDEILLVAGKNTLYTKHKTIPLARLHKIPIILREKGSGTLEVIEKELAKHQIALSDLNIKIHLGSTEAIKRFLYNFDGVALLSEKSVEKEINNAEIRIIKIEKMLFQRKFRLAFIKNTRPKTGLLLRDFLLHYNL